MSRTMAITVGVLLFFAVISSSRALQCYQCNDVTDAHVVFEGHPEREEDYKKSLLRRSKVACRARTSTRNIPEGHCVGSSDLDVGPACASGDVNIRTRFTFTELVGNKRTKVNGSVSFRFRFRACDNRKDRQIGCVRLPDPRYVELMQSFVALRNRYRYYNLEYTGTVCLCDTPSCNAHLPADEPEDLPPIQTAGGKKPEKGGGNNPENAAGRHHVTIATVVTTGLVFLLRHLISI